MKLLMKFSVIFQTRIFEFFVQFFCCVDTDCGVNRFFEEFIRFTVKAMTKTESVMR